MKDRQGSLVDVTEQKRLNDAREARIPWKKWGPYLSERQWGTVREDYSDDGNAWDYFRMTRLARALTGGARTDWAASATTSSASVSRWPCGTSGTRS